ncbi:MAG: type 1 glutamine amidotransferase [Bdellovibrionota bacterium]
MKNCLVIQHYDSTTAGSTFDWLVQKSIKFQVWRVDSQPEPDISKFEGLIVCGGKHNVDQVDVYPWLKREKEIIKERAEKGSPVLGLCLGGQLLAESIGGEVGPHKGWEIGWYPVQLANDEILTSFQYHSYRFLIPPKAELTVKGDYCLHQGFSYKNSMGFQFHPECTKEWIVNCTNGMTTNYQGNVQTAKQIIDDIANQVTLQNWYYKVLESWVK